MSFNMMEISQSLDTIAGMLKQELSYHPPGMEEDPTSERFSSVGIDSRGRMLTFFNDLVDRIGSSRETSEIAISYLDRFLASHHFGPQALRNKKLFQLASTTCLYIAIKIHELRAVTPSLLADLSRGVFAAQEVEEMELVLAQTLKWRLNPPTSLAFVRQYLELLPRKIMNRDRKRTAYDLARHQTEMALEDPRLFCEKKSLIAYMAVQNAIERLQVTGSGADLSDTVGVLLLPEEQMPSYQYASLQSILQLSLSSKFGVVATPTTCYMALTPPPPPPPPAQRKFITSWFATSTTTTNTKTSASPTPRTVSPPPVTHYGTSPRSVNNTMA